MFRLMLSAVNFRPDHEIVQFVGKVTSLALLHLDQPPRRLRCFQSLLLVLDEQRLSFSRLRRIHPEMQQHRDQQQVRHVENTVDEERFAQQERVRRNLEGIDGERDDREQHRQRPEQPGAARRRGKHQRKTEDRRDVELDPRDEIRNDKTQRDGEYDRNAPRRIIEAAPGDTRSDR